MFLCRTFLVTILPILSMVTGLRLGKLMVINSGVKKLRLFMINDLKRFNVRYSLKI